MGPRACREVWGAGGQPLVTWWFLPSPLCECLLRHCKQVWRLDLLLVPQSMNSDPLAPARICGDHGDQQAVHFPWTSVSHTSPGMVSTTLGAPFCLVRHCLPFSRRQSGDHPGHPRPCRTASLTGSRLASKKERWGYVAW
jgi:hypothetical protein